MIALAVTAKGHEVRPAYLGIIQVNDSSYHMTWKIPAMGDQAPKLYPVLPESWKVTENEARLIPGAVKREWFFVTHKSIKGQRIYIKGVESTMIDVLINIDLLSGDQFSHIIRADHPIYEIPVEHSMSEVIVTYLELGVDHILLGIDHLLFVLALIFVTKGKWKIIKTITAFTLAHSITLSLAALDLVHLPIPPVEAIIALSIVFLAKEILQHKEGAQESLTYRYPWIVAFSFGLLHGFGFASALSETGLPQNAIPAALAFFNVGVEIGQVVFVVLVLAALWLLNKLKIEWPLWLKKSPIYLIGGFASYWVIERILGFWQ